MCSIVYDMLSHNPSKEPILNYCGLKVLQEFVLKSNQMINIFFRENNPIRSQKN